jgi:4-amino-4-deoxy-L-arabinose transferase-like glycosyltransferase
VHATTTDLRSVITRHRTVLAGAGICGVFVLLSFWSAAGVRLGPIHTARNSVTFDEVSHIGSGYSYDRDRTLYLNPEHPPLVKMIAGLPLQFMHLQPGHVDRDLQLSELGQWNYGSSFLFEANGQRTADVVAAARLAVTLFNAGLLFCVFLLLYRLVSGRAALIAVSLIAFNPVILGHASLVTFDVPAGLTMLVCLLTYVGYLRRPSMGRAAIVGVALAVALLVKFSTVLLLPMIGASGLVWLGITRAGIKVWGRWLRDVALIGGVALLLTTTFMVLLTARMSAADMQAQFDTNWPGHLKGGARPFLRSLAGGGVYPKALAAWLNGFLIVQNVVEAGRGGTMFFGRQYGPEGPGPWFYPVLVATKPPIATVGLAVLTLGNFATRAVRRIAQRTAQLAARANAVFVVLLVYCGAYFAFATVQPFKLGVRHMFPFMIAVLAVVALIIDRSWTSSLVRRLSYSRFVPAAIGLIALATLTAFPHYIAFYNRLVGGTDRGYEVAVDSNYDWGQDMERLREWKERNHVAALYTDLFVNPYGVEQYYLGATTEVNSVLDADRIPPGGYVLVSATRLVLREFENHLTYAQVYPQPAERVGESIFVFRRP